MMNRVFTALAAVSLGALVSGCSTEALPLAPCDVGTGMVAVPATSVVEEVAPDRSPADALPGFLVESDGVGTFRLSWWGMRTIASVSGTILAEEVELLTSSATSLEDPEASCITFRRAAWNLQRLDFGPVRGDGRITFHAAKEPVYFDLLAGEERRTSTATFVSSKDLSDKNPYTVPFGLVSAVPITL